MAINLSKGVNVNLTKEVPTLKNIIAGLGWKPRSTDGQAFDLDASVLLLNENGKLEVDENIVFFNNKVSPCKSTYTEGDNLTGEGTGDDEVIHIDLTKIPSNVNKLVFAVTIYEGQQRGQNFGQVGDAYIKISDSDNKTTIAQYDLDEDSSGSTSLIFGELYRNNDDWKFKAIGESIKTNSILDIIALYK